MYNLFLIKKLSKIPPRLTMNKREIKFFAIAFFILLVFRLAILMPTIGKFYMGPFRLGIQPLNDGLEWLDGARDILAGRKMLARPLLSLLLSLFVVLFKNNFFIYFAFFILLNITGFLIAFYLLKDIRNNIAVVVFLAFLSMWNAPLGFSICTENLATPLLTVAFALLIRGIYYSSYNYFFLAYFLIAFAQTVRPWDFFSLITLPLFPVIYSGFCKKTFIVFAILILVIVLGISYHVTGSKLYSAPEANEIFPMRILTQVRGGGSIFDLYADKDILTVTLKNGSANERIKLFYKKAWKELRENTWKLKRAFMLTFIFFIGTMPYFFDNRIIGSIFYVLAIFFVFFFYFYERADIKNIISSLRDYKRLLLLILLIAAVLINAKLAFSILAAIGLLYILILGSRPKRILISLYLTGIIVSLLFNGGVGGEREWMSIEILLYYGLGLGIFCITKRLQKEEYINKDFTFNIKNSLSSVSLIFVLFLAFFIIIPTLLRINNSYKKQQTPLIITTDQVKQALKINGPVVSPNEFLYFKLKWPEPSYETINLARCYWKLRYRDYHALYLTDSDGTAENDPRYWFLQPLSFSRTVYLEDKIIFPRVEKTSLSQFEEKEIVVFGQLLGKPRKYFRDSGYVILAENIGYINEKGQLNWIDIEDLQN